MSNKVKGRKMDTYTVSSQKYEIQYIATKFGVTPECVRQIKKKFGKSRKKIYNQLRLQQQEINEDTAPYKDHF